MQQHSLCRWTAYCIVHSTLLTLKGQLHKQQGLQHMQALRTNEEQVRELLVVQLQKAALHGAVAVDGLQVGEDLVDGAWDDARHDGEVAPIRALPVAALSNARKQAPQLDLLDATSTCSSVGRIQCSRISRQTPHWLCS